MYKQTIVFFAFVFTIFPSGVFSQTDDHFKKLLFIGDFVNHGIGLPSMPSDTNIRALGRIISVDVKPPFESPHDKGVMLEERTYNFHGLQVSSIFVKGQNESGLVTKAVVTNSMCKIYKDLNVGSSTGTVIKVLGEPTNKSEKSYEYCGVTGVDCAIFEISENKIVKITFMYYVD